MANRRRGRSLRFVFVILILVSLTVITVYYRGHARTLVSDLKGVAHDVVDPIGHFVAAVVHPVEHFVQGAVDYGSLEKANARLRAANERLQSQKGTASAAENEVDQLKQQLALPYLQGIPTVAADVIDATPSNFEDSIEIDKGSSSGIASGMPVVSGGGLVGTVIQVSHSTAVVDLLTDASTRIAVRFASGPGATDIGVANGEGAGDPMKIQFVNPHDQLHRGELVYTSGLSGGLFPPDIPVGKIKSVAASAGSLQLDVTVSPLADLANLQYVSVAEWEPVG